MKSLKFKAISFNNHKKQFLFTYASDKKASVHYSQLGITSPVSTAWIDKETRGQSIGFTLLSGETDFIPYDQPLALVRDSDYLLQNQIEIIIAQIKDEIRDKKLSKKYLAEQLKTSDNQIQRLLNPKILNKNLTQLYHILTLLKLEPEFRLHKAAA